MKHFFFSVILFAGVVPSISFSQNPYIGDAAGEGTGQYGYLDKDNASFFRLYRNTHNNVNSLAARVRVTNNAGTVTNEVLYNVSGGSEWGTCTNWQCSGCNVAGLTTSNYAPADFGVAWEAGATFRAAVNAYYCGGASNLGYNERTMQVVDFNNQPVINQPLPVSAAGCSKTDLVGTFTLNVGTLSGKSLSRFFFQNNGTALEGTDLPNDVFKLYYEPATGFETFSGTESFAPLYGDWGGDATNNNIFGSDGLSIPLSGTTRFYLVACGNYTTGKTVVAASLNDGLGLSPGNDGKSTLRVAATSIAIGGGVVLPVSFGNFHARFMPNCGVELMFETLSEQDVLTYTIEQSIDGASWLPAPLPAIPARNSGNKEVYFCKLPPTGGNTSFLRVKETNSQGKIQYSQNSKIQGRCVQQQYQLGPNPAGQELYVQSNKAVTGGILSIYNAAGVLQLQKVLLPHQRQLISLATLTPGYYWVKIVQDGQTVLNQSIIRQ